MASKTPTISKKCEFTQKFLGCPGPDVEFSQSYQLDVAKLKNETVLYGSKKQVVVRDLADPSASKMVSGHLGNVTVARLAPNKNWVASGDTEGKCRVWALNRTEYVKTEKETFRIKDIKWGPNSEKIAAGGISGSNKVTVFRWDTGSDVGKCTGHMKGVNCISYKPTRPFRVISGSEDFTVNMYGGPPFKLTLDSSVKNKGFVNGVAHSPDGSKACAVTSMSELVLIDSKTNAVKAQNVNDEAKGGHKGMILGCMYTSDSKKIVTCGGDRTVRSFDADTGAATGEVFQVKPGADLQKHTCVHGMGFAGDVLIGATAGGDIVQWGDAKDAPTILPGHTTSVTGVVLHAASGRAFSGDVTGCVLRWNKPGVAERIAGNADAKDDRLVHPGGVVAIGVIGDMLFTAGGDQNCRVVKVDAASYAGAVCTPLGGTPVAMATGGGKAVVALSSSMLVLLDGAGAKLHELKLQGDHVGVALAVNCDGSEVAVATKTHTMLRFSVKDGKLAPGKALSIDGKPATALAYSPDGKFFAMGDMTGGVKYYKVTSEGSPVFKCWKHSSRVTSVDWSADSKNICTSSMGREMAIWWVGDKRKKIMGKQLHGQSINGVKFIDGASVVSCSSDNSVRWWSLEKPEKK